MTRNSRWEDYYMSEYNLQWYDFKNKKACMNNYIATMLRRTMTMFEWENLPKSVDWRMLEFFLQTRGIVAFYEYQGQLYFFTGGLGGEPDVYYRPTIFTIANPGLNISVQPRINYGNEENVEPGRCVLMRNDSLGLGLMAISRRYSTLLTENDLSIKIASINARATEIMVASDDNTAKSAREFIRQREDGNLAVITQSYMSESDKLVQGNQGAANETITNLIELQQYLKASWFNELGLNANYNMKRESLNSEESQMNFDALIPLIDDMLQQREKACELINEYFGTDMHVKLHGAWEQLQNQEMNPQGMEGMEGMFGEEGTDMQEEGMINETTNSQPVEETETKNVEEEQGPVGEELQETEERDNEREAEENPQTEGIDELSDSDTPEEETPPEEPENAPEGEPVEDDEEEELSDEELSKILGYDVSDEEILHGRWITINGEENEGKGQHIYIDDNGFINNDAGFDSNGKAKRNGTRDTPEDLKSGEEKFDENSDFEEYDPYSEESKPNENKALTFDDVLANPNVVKTGGFKNLDKESVNHFFNGANEVLNYFGINSDRLKVCTKSHSKSGYIAGCRAGQFVLYQEFFGPNQEDWSMQHEERWGDNEHEIKGKYNPKEITGCHEATHFVVGDILDEIQKHHDNQWGDGIGDSTRGAVWTFHTIEGYIIMHLDEEYARNYGDIIMPTIDKNIGYCRSTYSHESDAETVAECGAAYFNGTANRGQTEVINMLKVAHDTAVKGGSLYDVRDAIFNYKINLGGKDGK